MQNTALAVCLSHDKHKKAFIRADSWRSEILAKFHTYVKG